jgi:hypothetical protein
VGVRRTIVQTPAGCRKSSTREGTGSADDDLAAKQAITEVIYRDCRALHRIDRELGDDRTDPSYPVLGWP